MNTCFINSVEQCFQIYRLDIEHAKSTTFLVLVPPIAYVSIPFSPLFESFTLPVPYLVLYRVGSHQINNRDNCWWIWVLVPGKGMGGFRFLQLLFGFIV